MTDDHHDADAMDELDELLSLADGPVHFPEPARRSLLDQLIRTASMPRVEPASAPIVPLVSDNRAGRPPRLAWVAGAAASLVVIIAFAVVFIARLDTRSQPPADQLPAVPMTVDEVCAMLPPLAAANGLGQESVQIDDVNIDDLEELRGLLAHLSSEAGGTVSPELIGDADTRIRLVQISIGAVDSDAAVSAMKAAGNLVGAVIDHGC